MYKLSFILKKVNLLHVKINSCIVSFWWKEVFKSSGRQSLEKT